MNLRITQRIQRPPPVTLWVDGRTIDAHPGESLAAALLAAGIGTLRHAPRDGAPRGAFCFMGACQECLLTVDGQRVLACLEPVRSGLRVSTGTSPHD